MIDFATQTASDAMLTERLIRHLGLHCRMDPKHKSGEIFTRDNFQCVYCGTDMLAGLDALLSVSLDHVVPKAAGGKSSAANLVASCRACNTLKADALTSTVAEGRTVIGRHRAMLIEALGERFAELGYEFPRRLDRTSQPILTEISSILGSQADEIVRAVRVIGRVLETA